MVRRGLFVCFLIVVALYTYSVTNEFIRGPQLTVEEPKNGITATSSPITVSGTAKNIAHITLNERPIFVTTDMVFRETLSLLPGYNILNVTVSDRYGRVREEKRVVMYLPPVITPQPMMDTEDSTATTSTSTEVITTTTPATSTEIF